MCMPHTGSRTNRRAAVGDGIPSEGSRIVDQEPAGLEPPTDDATQEPQAPGKYEQPKQETYCASEKVHWNQCLPSGPLTEYPANRCEGSVCKAKRVSQTKRRNFKRLRGEWSWGGEDKRPGNLA